MDITKNLKEFSSLSFDAQVSKNNVYNRPKKGDIVPTEKAIKASFSFAYFSKMTQ